MPGGKTLAIFVFTDAAIRHIVVYNGASRDMSETKKAISTVSHYYSSRGFSLIMAIYSDNEPSLVALRSELATEGITVETTGAGRKNGIAERSNRTIENKSESIKASVG